MHNKWDIVARSADGHRLLLGEAKWSDRPVTAAGLRGIAKELEAKGVPPVAGVKRGAEVVRAVFVPRAAKGAGAEDGFHLVDAAEVLGVLRQEREEA